MWNTCEQLQAVKQWKYEGDLFFCLLKKFTVPVLFTSSLRMQNNCRLFTSVGSDDEIKARKVIAYTWIGLYHLLSIMLLHIYKKKAEGRVCFFAQLLLSLRFWISPKEDVWVWFHFTFLGTLWKSDKWLLSLRRGDRNAPAQGIHCTLSSSLSGSQGWAGPY